ncbi:MAG: DUF86 domain-containing protein [FCB group bacterium]|jgi:uncharacterized protein with HEPN domain|nr:DUF86 domain-containing protein [FCB group bacterium]
MRPDTEDMARLWDILDAARAIREFTQGLSYQEFLDDRKTRNAVERNLEIIGEAAKRISLEFRKQPSDIPWNSIIGLRNVLAHEYGEIRHEVIWSIVGDKLIPLIRHLEDLGVDNPPSL